MQPYEYYVNSKSKWPLHEDEQLRREYLVWNHDVIKIADIHKRTPGTIAYRLKKLGIIENHQASRGYDIYLSSELYQTIVRELKDKEDKYCKKCRQRYPHDSFEPGRNLCKDCCGKKQIQIILPDTQQLVTRIDALETKLDKVLELLHAVYTFEEAT